MPASPLFRRLNQKGWAAIRRIAAYVLLPAMLLETPAFAARKSNPVGVKAKITSRGVGDRVRVTLVDRTEETGSILAIHDNDFVLRQGAAPDKTIAYDQVTAVHKGPRTGEQKVVIAAVAAGVTALVVGIICAIRIAHGVIGG